MEKDNIFKFQLFKLQKIKPNRNYRSGGSKLPKARSGHRVVADEANLYSFGGYAPCTRYSDNGEVEVTPHLFQELWKYNFASNIWTKLSPTGNAPTELASPAVLLSQNGHLLVFGGSGVPFGSSSSNKLHVCSLRKPDWKEVKTEGERPLKQYGQGMALDGHNLYVIGGTTGFFYTMEVHRLNLKTQMWDFLNTTNKPEERYRHEVALYEGRIYIFGGGTSVLSYGFEEVPVFHIDSQKWERQRTIPDSSTVQGYPKARRSHGCVHLGNYVYICGGYNGHFIIDDIWRLSLKTFEWKKLPVTLSCPVFFHSAAITPSGQMFVFGGVTSIIQNSRTNDLYSVWLVVPSLQEMCWSAILHYAPRISSLSSDKLRKAGIPRAFVDRVNFSN